MHMNFPFSALYRVPARLGHLPRVFTGFWPSVTRNTHSGSSRPIPVPPRLAALESAEETALARAWVAKFRAVEIPKASVELSFSRSSGPGGQNVNKVNTKATLRCRIDEVWIPLWAKAELKRSPHYVSSSQSIQITSTVHRSQSQNIDECLSKFHAVLVEASSSGIKNEPTDAQRKRVEGLVKAATARRRSEKAHRSKVKARRKGSQDD
ncbi:RF-1 domain-containing protein [Mycena latifolia]|nr:RF-1 domain-containing protein [Mycena latifolia]